MPLFEIKPTDMNDEVWDYWKPQELIVRAATEGEARGLAGAVERVKPITPWGTKHNNPWTWPPKKDASERPTICQEIEPD